MYTLDSQLIVIIRVGCQGLMGKSQNLQNQSGPHTASWPDEEEDRRDLIFQEKEGLGEGLHS